MNCKPAQRHLPRDKAMPSTRSDQTISCATAAVLLGLLAGCQRPAQPLPAPPVFPPATVSSPSSRIFESSVDNAAAWTPGQSDFIKFSGSDTVYFTRGSSDIDLEASAILDRQAQWLVRNPGIRATLHGHTDERETGQAALAIAERRASAMRRHLVSRGVAVERLSVKSFGKEQPVAAGSTQTDWARNRRGQTVLLPLGQ